MPLPLALLARLKKRGIVKPVEPEIEEEVIAEDYDDNEKRDENGVQERDNDGVEMTDESLANQFREPAVGCPNKWNIYHECLLYCREAWGDGKLQPSPSTERKRLKMLKKYPVLDGWEEVYDAGTGRHYYWNTRTDEVSWLPPGHPRSKISVTAEKLRALLKDSFLEGMDEVEEPEQEPSDSEDEDSEDGIERVVKETERIEKRHRREHFKERFRGRPKMRENDLDPMDPAAYSEAPRGTWASGLERKGEAKTGADTTASGPLYQMRPYPSPGAVLRMNAEIKVKDDSDSDET